LKYIELNSSPLTLSCKSWIGVFSGWSNWRFIRRS